MVNSDNIDELIKFAIDLITKDIIKFSQFNYLYPFTTENINAYLNKFDLKDKSLFTVGSSSDQALNAILCGCNDITLYDVCPFTKVYYYLKMAAIKTLSREEYLKFFCHKYYIKYIFNNIHTFDKNTFSKISESLKDINEEAYYFWSELFK